MSRDLIYMQMYIAVVMRLTGEGMIRQLFVTVMNQNILSLKDIQNIMAMIMEITTAGIKMKTMGIMEIMEIMAMGEAMGEAMGKVMGKTMGKTMGRGMVNTKIPYLI